MPIASEVTASVPLAQAGESPPVAPWAPKTPREHHKTLMVIVVIILVLLAAVAIAVVTLGVGSNRKSSGIPGASIAPGAALTFASKNYNYSIRLPANWTRLEAAEYLKAIFEQEAKDLTADAKQALSNYYSSVDTMYWDDKSTSAIRPKFLVRASEGATLDGEAAGLKQLLATAYSGDLLEDKTVSFQNEDAQSVTFTGTLGQNEVRGKNLVFARGSLVFTIGLIALEADWKNNLDSLFEAVSNSFKI